MNLQISIASTEEEKAICYALRHNVFVEEQGVPKELELDEHDEDGAIHFLGRFKGNPVSAARVCKFGDAAKIQRVVVMKSHRGQNFGREIMLFMMEYIKAQKLAPVMALDAQIYALLFYQALGFEEEGEEFDDAGIPHIHMVQRV